MKPKSEKEFLLALEQKAKEERKLVETTIMPNWARSLGDWLAIHPWRVIVPGAGILYLVSRFMYGIKLREFILGLFGGF